MRCLVKNMAMFGFGMFIYEGEDLPEDITDYYTFREIKKPNPKPEPQQVEISEPQPAPQPIEKKEEEADVL